MRAEPQRRMKSPAPSFTPVQSGLLQRKCSCGGSPGADGECADFNKKKLQRQAGSETRTPAVLPFVHEAFQPAGRPLDHEVRALKEPHYGHDFSRVRVHSDLQAEAFTNSTNAIPRVDDTEDSDPDGSAEVQNCKQNTNLVKDRAKAARPAIMNAAADLRRVKSLPEEDRGNEWNGTRYSCWFGEYAEDAFEAISSIVTEMESVSNNPSVRCRRCLLMSRNVNASSVPFDSKRRVNLCPSWFKWPLEKMTFILIHEMAHIAGAESEEEEVYGSDNAKILAETKPVDARQNADNYAFFVVGEEC